MTSVMKSPNMMSTTGRMPVIAAPSPIPEMPASEIGESMIRSGPNSSRRPDSTWNGVPASATSSPMTKTVGSRRSSSASASFTACESVSSRVAGCVAGIALDVNVLVHLARVGVRRRERELHSVVDLSLGLATDLVQRLVGDALLAQSRRQQSDRVALRGPLLLLLLRAVVRAVDVADVVPVEAVRIEDEEGGAVAAPRPLDRALRRVVHGAHVLAVDLPGRNAERLGAGEHLAGRRLRVVRVLAVEVVLAGVDHRQLPERGHVHHLVEDALAERAVAEEADGDLLGTAHLRGHRRSGRDARRAADDRVRAEVAILVVGDVHRAALAAAVPGLLAEQLGEHAVDRGALGEAVAVAAVRGGDVVVLP